MAIALVMIKEGINSPYDIEIIRSTEDLRAREYEGSDFVIDTGKDFDPRKNWFDHHQFPRNAKPACSFTLVARKYKLDLTKFPWAEQLAVMDSKGPYVWFESIVGRRPKNGRELTRVNGAGSSIFDYIGSLGNVDFRMAIRMAKNWLEFQISHAEKQAQFVSDALRIAKIIDLGSCKMAYFDAKDPRGILTATDKLAGEDPLIIISGMLDERSDGYSAIRMNDDPRVDFSPRETEDGCIFAHKTGFVLKWRKNWDEFIDAIKRSVVNN